MDSNSALLKSQGRITSLSAATTLAIPDGADVLTLQPKAPINKRKASHKVMPSQATNKGDKWSDKHGCFLRPLPKR